MNIKEAAAYLGVHQNTVRKWADRGKVAHRRLPDGGYRQFERGELDEFKAQLRREVGR